MIRSTVFAMVLGLMLGAACKKGNETSAGQKTQETPAMTDKAKAAGQTPASTDGPNVQAGGIERAADEGAAAMLVSATGTVEVRRVGEPTWGEAKADTKLYTGDQIRTAEKGSATIMLADQSSAEVAETSTVAIGSREGSADPASSAAVLAGMARFTVPSRAAGEGAFRVYTPTGVALSTGTTFGVGVAANGETRFGVETGEAHVVGISAMDAEPMMISASTQVIIAADGKVGATSAWTTDDWGTWRDETDAKVDVAATIKAHGDAMAELNGALTASYTELQGNADSAATFEATAATSAEKNDAAAYTAAQPEFAATIDASFAMAGRIEALTWANAARASLATDLYVRHPDTAKASWDVVAPRVDMAVLWPKQFEVTATAFWQPLRTQYYIHHPRGRMHAQFVGVTVPSFYAAVQPQPIDPMMVRGKVKGQIWMAPQIAYTASTRPMWMAAPEANWHAKAKLNVAPPRAKVAWYVRPATLKSTAFIAAPIKGTWKSSLNVGAPQPRAALAASWKIPVGTKIKIDPPNMDMAAKARATAKFDAKAPAIAAPKVDVKGQIDGKANAAMDAKANIKGKMDVQAPAVTVPKVDVKAQAGAAGNAAAGVKGKVDGAVKANADMKVKAPEVKPPAVKVDAKVKASGGIKLGN